MGSKAQEPVAVIGAGLDLGAGRRGVDMGPSAIRYAGLQERIERLGRRCVDWGDVEVGLPEATEVGDPRARYLAAILRSCARVAALVAAARTSGYLPLVLGGDHSIAIGTLGGLARAAGPGAVLWIDAHGDLNRPESSTSGNVHGMPLAAALGDAVARARRPVRRPLARRRRAGADRQAERARVHDERPRPRRRRAGDARGARVPLRRAFPPRQPRPRRGRPDGRAGRGHPGARWALLP